MASDPAPWTHLSFKRRPMHPRPTTPVAVALAFAAAAALPSALAVKYPPPAMSRRVAVGMVDEVGFADAPHWWAVHRPRRLPASTEDVMAKVPYARALEVALQHAAAEAAEAVPSASPLPQMQPEPSAQAALLEVQPAAENETEKAEQAASVATNRSDRLGNVLLQDAQQSKTEQLEDHIQQLQSDTSSDAASNDKLILGALCLFFTVIATAMLLLWFCSRSAMRGGQRQASLARMEDGRASRSQDLYQGGVPARSREIRGRHGDGIGDSSEDSDVSETKREDIVERLACMLESSSNVTDITAGTSEVTRYVAAMPEALPVGDQNTLKRWYLGYFGFWESHKAFSRGTRPLSSFALTSIVKIETAPVDKTVIMVRSQDLSIADGVLKEFSLRFATADEARLWASSLLALIEQLRDKAALGTFSG